MDGLLGKILKEMERVPERKLDITFDDVPHCQADEQVVGKLTKEERQLFCLYRDLILRIERMEADHARHHTEHPGSTVTECGAFHKSIHIFEVEALALYDMLFGSIHYRLNELMQLGVRRGGTIVTRKASIGVLEQIVALMRGRSPHKTETMH